MNELPSADFVTADEINVVDQRTSEPGFFSAIGAAALSEGLVLGKPDERYIISLVEGERQFTFYHLRPTEHFPRPGMLIGSITLEVERATAFRADRETGSPGDVILSNGDWYIVAAHTEGFREASCMRLWDGMEMAHSRDQIGFRSWRLTIGTGSEKRLLWQRVIR